MGQAAFSSHTHGAFLPAVRARVFDAEAPEGIDVWKYAFPLGFTKSLGDLHVRYAGWNGIFRCSPGRHVEIIPWPAASSVVIVAANAVYIVDPSKPEQFSGVDAPVEINGVTFDENAGHMFVADSLRIYAFSSDRVLQWMSEPLDGYGARFRGCGGRVLAVEINQTEPDPECHEAPPTLIRLRTEDGTVLRSRFRLAHHYRTQSFAHLH